MSDIREVYNVVVSFDVPNEGIVSIPARSADHAALLITDQFKNRKNLNIVDVFKMSDVKMPSLDPVIEDAQVIEELPAKAETKQIEAQPATEETKPNAE
jgi:hypothetical protein